MTQTEASVCARLLWFRESAKWPRASFAYELGISRNRLASIEYARTPLRYDLGRAICERFNLSQAWLAEGIGEPNPFIEIHPSVEKKIPPRALFTMAFSHFLKPALGNFRLAVLKRPPGSGISVQFTTPAGSPMNQFAERALWGTIRTIFRKLPIELQSSFCRALLREVERFNNANSHEINSGKRKRVKQIAGSKPSLENTNQEFEKQLLVDNMKGSDTTQTVQSFHTYGDLLDRLRKITQPRGAKAALARKFNVSRQAVDKWLSGESKPSAEIAIELQHWKPDQPKK